MTKIKVTIPMAGLRVCYMPGIEYDFEDAEADNLIAAGNAVAVDPEYKPKTPPPLTPVTLDKTPSQPVEKLDTVKVVEPGKPATPSTNAALTTANITSTPAAAPSAVDVVKKAGK